MKLENITEKEFKPTLLQRIRNSATNKFVSLFALGTFAFAGCGTSQQNSCKNDFDCPGQELCIDNYCVGEESCNNDFDCPGDELCVDNVCTNSQPNSSADIPNTTKVLSNSEAAYLENVSNDKSTLIFDDDSKYAQNLNNGDVIVAGINNKTPKGILRKVISTTHYGNQITVKTQQATLEDAIQNGTVKAHLDFSEDYLGKADAMMDNVSVETKQFPLSTGLNINFDNTNLYNNILFLDGNLDMSLGADLEVDINWFKVERVRYTLTGTEDLELKIRGEYSQIIHDQLPPIEPVKFPPIAFAIGPVPVIITPNFTITFGVDANGELSAETSIQQSTELQYGVEYNNKQWSPIKNFDNHFNYSPFSFSKANASIEVYAKPKFSLELYGVAGPYGAVKGFLGANVNFLDNPWCDVYVGLNVSAGVHVDVFGKTLADFETNVYNFKKEIATCKDTADCNPKNNKTCYDANNDGNKDVIWMDSCGNLDEVIDYCNSNEDCKNNSCVPIQTGCTSNQYECDSGFCISKLYLCDGDEDCNSGEDEDNCSPTCNDECSPSGKKECVGDDWKKCGDYDSDSCLEWSSKEYCGNNETCENGSCVEDQPQCTSNNYKSCYQGDVWSFDSCNQPENVAKECKGTQKCNDDFCSQIKCDSNSDCATNIGEICKKMCVDKNLVVEEPSWNFGQDYSYSNCTNHAQCDGDNTCPSICFPSSPDGY
ncbi:hypothetical protein HOA91_00950 [Candidatus Woesearchaeota archaeon]|jgi:hypothetical protein|nr:hypothetical protein [Candidatus Woesearchaeota archaeon]